MNWEEACRILGIGETASDKEIHDQYIYKNQLLHPDKTWDKPENVRIKAQEELKHINEAYSFLKDPINNPYKNPPKVEVFPKRIRFKDVEIGQKKTTTFEIRNAGGTYTNIWIDNKPASWLSVTGVRSLTNEQLPLEVTIESIGSGEVGERHKCVLLVRLENGKTQSKDEVKLEIELWRKVEPPILEIDTEEIDATGIKAGDNTSECIVELSNTGRSLLKGTISTHKPWISVHPNTINIPPSGKQSYTVLVTTSSLPHGYKDKDSISINSNGGTCVIPIDFSVAQTEPQPIQTTMHQMPQEAYRGFSFNEFWSTLGKFVVYPVFFFWITCPVLFFLYQYQLVFWFVVVIYVSASFIVAIARGVSKGENEGLTFKKAQGQVYEQQRRTLTSTTSRDIWKKSTLASGTNLVIANTFRGVYHKPSCEWAKKISGNNAVNLTAEEARRRGYSPCRICRP